MKKPSQHSSRSKTNHKAKAEVSKKKSVSKNPPVKREPNVPGPSLFEKFESFGSQHEKWLMLGMIILSIICSVLIFDLKFSIGGDDTSYIERAYNYVHKGEYPYYQGAGYHLVLAGIMKVFGYKVGMFKIFSLLFYTGHIAFTW